MNIKFKVTGKKPYNTIYIRFYKAKLDVSTSTEISVKLEHWDYKKQQLRNVNGFKNYNLIKIKLLEVETAVYEAYNKDFINGIPIDAEWLRNVVFNVFKRETHEINKDYSDVNLYFSDWCDNWVIKAHESELIKKNGRKFNDTDKHSYQFAVRELKKYETFSNKRYKMSQIDRNLKSKFKDFLMNQEYLTAHSVMNCLTKLSSIHKRVVNSGIKINMDWNNLTNTVEDKHHDIDLTYLNEEEIQSLIDLDLSHSKNLDVSRDNFIIGLRTGLRVSDYLTSINEDNVKQGRIHLRTKKTRTDVVIPIHPNIKDILDKWGGLPPKLHRITFNKKIKIVCQLAGIDKVIKGGVIQEVELWDKSKALRKVFGEFPKHELISSHTARRSFATNLYLDGVDNKTIMEVGGWSSEKMMLHYVKQFGDASSKVVAENWGIKLKSVS